ncbi:MAG: hypothetical protein RR342_03735 [Bacilli bacterium]
MEVFIRDEETKWDISYSLADSNNSLDCKDHKPIIVKSLDQHDAEVRKQVIAELEKEKQTSVKEFADKLKSILLDYGTIEQSNIIAIIDKLLKERGIE